MLTEAETRQFIDEQLRKVDREADTDALHYSKGTHPQNGYNIAIAEWSTDDGFVDYVLFVGIKPVVANPTETFDDDKAVQNHAKSLQEKISRGREFVISEHEDRLTTHERGFDEGK